MPLDWWDGHSVDDLVRAWGVRRVEAWETLASTSDRAAELAAEGCEPWTVVVADEQTAGRGRQGDRWQSAARAGLWMTVVTEPYRGNLPIPLVVGAACIEAIDAVAPPLRTLIKWPNDLYVGARKVGGLLCEGRGGRVLIGIGINTASPAEGFHPDIDTPPTSLEVESGNVLARSELADGVLGRLRTRLSDPKLERDTRALLADRDCLTGRVVETEEQGPGTARGIDDSGALVLERPDGSRVRVRSGRVRPQDARSRRG